MDKHYEEEIELKSSEYLEIIKKVEKAAEIFKFVIE